MPDLNTSKDTDVLASYAQKMNNLKIDNLDQGAALLTSL